MGQSDKRIKGIYKVPAVEQAILVMLSLADSGSNSKSLTDICAEVGIYKSKAFSILNTLSEYGLVKKNPNRRGSDIINIKSGCLNRTSPLSENRTTT